MICNKKYIFEFKNYVSLVLNKKMKMRLLICLLLFSFNQISATHIVGAISRTSMLVVLPMILLLEYTGTVVHK